MNKRKEFWALDWIRFGLAVYLVLYHTWFEYSAFVEHAAIFRFFGLGNMATSVFFVLSGFLLTHVYAPDARHIAIDKQAFLVSRFSTLYPLHLFGIALSLPLVLLVVMKEGGITVPLAVGSDAVRTLGTGETLFALASQLTLTHAWNPFYLLFDVPSWSLSALFFFYLLFPFVVGRLSGLRAPLLGLCVLGVLFTIPGAIAQYAGLTGMVADGVLHRNPLIRLPLFLGGITLYACYQRFHPPAKPSAQESLIKSILLILVGITIAVGAHYYLVRKENLFPLIRNGLYFPAALAIVWLAATTRTAIGKYHQLLAARLGKAALSIFMLHLPLYGLLSKTEKLVRAGLATDFTGIRPLLAAAREIAPLASLYPVHVVLIVGLSILFQERVVTPLQGRLKRSLTARVRATAPVLAESAGAR